MNALKAAVIFMGILIVLGVAVVVVTIVGRLSAPSEDSAPAAVVSAAPALGAFGSRDLDLPAGARIIETVAGDGRLYLHVRLSDGAERVLIIDPNTGATLGTLRGP